MTLIEVVVVCLRALFLTMALSWILLPFAFAEVMAPVYSEAEFRRSEGKLVMLEGNLFRSKRGTFLIGDEFSVILKNFNFEAGDFGKKWVLSGIATIYRQKITMAEWRDISDRQPGGRNSELRYIHSGYRRDQLVLRANKKKE